MNSKKKTYSSLLCLLRLFNLKVIYYSTKRLSYRPNKRDDALFYHEINLVRLAKGEYI